jgi:hypothetical protein
VAGVMTFSTGIFLTAVRFYEPLFRFLIVKDIYEYWGEIYSDESTEQEQQINNDALSSFLNSSLNVELVFIILKSINFFSEEYVKKLRRSYLGVAVVETTKGEKTALTVQRIDFTQTQEEIRS